MDQLPKELLYTNAPPTKHQSDHVRQLMLQREREALDLDEQYHIMQSALQDLAARQQQTRRDIEVLSAVFAPIRRIPVELLAQIFKFCVRDIRILAPRLGYTIDDPRAAPTVLTHVCSIWRDVAVSTPRLWNRLVLEVSTRSTRRTYTVSMLETLVLRSNPHPVSVVVYCHNDEARHVLPILAPLMALPQLAERMESLEIDLPTPYFHPLCHLTAPTFPLLQTLTLGLGRGSGSTVTSVMEFFRHSPRLRRLHVLGGGLEPGAPILALDFPSLTELYISTALDLTTACVVLSACIALETCSLKLLPSSLNPQDFPPCTLPHLRQLTLRTVSTDSCFPFFTIFTFPNLCELDVDVSEWPENALFDLHQRCRFTLLTKLCLRNVGCSATALTRFLILNPTIEDLSLSGFTDQGIIRALTLTHNPQSSILLPQLKSLSITLESSDVLAEDGAELVEMLRSRCGEEEEEEGERNETRPHMGSAPFEVLQHVGLDICGPVMDSDVEEAIAHLIWIGILCDYGTRESQTECEDD